MSNRLLLTTGLGIAALVAVFLSPFASSHPDGLDRVITDHRIEAGEPLAQKLPFHQVFDEYAARGVPKAIATPMAGLVGTLVTFGLAWGTGKILVKTR